MGLNPDKEYTVTLKGEDWAWISVNITAAALRAECPFPVAWRLVHALETYLKDDIDEMIQRLLSDDTGKPDRP